MVLGEVKIVKITGMIAYGLRVAGHLKHGHVCHKFQNIFISRYKRRVTV